MPPTSKLGLLEVRQCKIYYCIRVKLRLFRVYIENFTTDYFVCTVNAHA